MLTKLHRITGFHQQPVTMYGMVWAGGFKLDWCLHATLVKSGITIDGQRLRWQKTCWDATVPCWNEHASRKTFPHTHMHAYTYRSLALKTNDETSKPWERHVQVSIFVLHQDNLRKPDWKLKAKLVEIDKQIDSNYARSYASYARCQKSNHGRPFQRRPHPTSAFP